MREIDGGVRGSVLARGTEEREIEARKKKATGWWHGELGVAVASSLGGFYRRRGRVLCQRSPARLQWHCDGVRDEAAGAVAHGFGPASSSAW